MKEERQRIIREILTGESVPSQETLVERLAERGVSVTQSSVCRDLRDLGVGKLGGVYRLPDAGGPAEASLDAALGEFLLGVLPAGPNLVVVHTVVGGASRVGLAIDQARWPEVVGTVAGDDSLFVATPGVRDQRRLLARLAQYLNDDGKGTDR